jgi:hypothetical protein
MRGGDDSRAGGASKIGNPPRLTEESGVDPWLADLVRSTGPYKSPPGRKQRVLLSLGRSKGGRAPLVLRPVIVAGLLLGCGAFASAALGPWRGWIGRAYERLVPPAEPVAVSPERVRTPRLAAGHAVVVAGQTEGVAAQALAVAAPSVEGPSPDVAPPAAASVARRAPVVSLHPRHAAPPSATHDQAKRELARDRDEEDQETQAVLAGMRALRVDHDPVRARTLLARYLERHPNGALAEEAVALTIEAALAHQDDDAGALGALYLRRYPGGPFKALALRAKR